MDAGEDPHLARTSSAGWLVLVVALGLATAAAGANDEAALRARIAELEQQCADTAATGWQHPESWQRLERGMTRFRVYDLLGEPGKIARYDGFERWEYPDFLGGRVNFDDTGHVKGWRAPR
jgi:hypothetical protein